MSPPPPPPHRGHVFRLIKISQTIFEKGHQRNNPVKLFQNLTRRFRGEEFWRISLKSTQWKKPLPTVAMFLDGSKYREQFLKKVTQGTILRNYSKFWPAVSEKKIFKEFLHARLLQKVSPPWRPCFTTDQNFANDFWKGSPKEHSCEIISKSDQGFQRRRFFKNFFMLV